MFPIIHRRYDAGEPPSASQKFVFGYGGSLEMALGFDIYVQKSMLLFLAHFYFDMADMGMFWVFVQTCLFRFWMGYLGNILVITVITVITISISDSVWIPSCT